MFSGKSTTADLLQDHLNYVVVRARDVLRSISVGTLPTRQGLQRFGEELDRVTNGKWLGEAAAAAAARHPSRPVIVDAARTVRQVEAVRAALPHVRHIHLYAHYDELKRRFAHGTKNLIEPPSFEEAILHPIEQEAMKLGEHADLTVDSSLEPPGTLLHSLVAYLGKGGFIGSSGLEGR